MITLAALICSSAFLSPNSSSLDNALDAALGAGGLTRQSAVFDPVALAYYRTGEFQNPIVLALAGSPWETPKFMDVTERDVLLSNGQPHKLLAAASRLTSFGSRRDLLADPSANFVGMHKDGSALGRVVDKYRSEGLLTSEASSEGLVPDAAKRALAILMDCALAERPLFNATFPDSAKLARLKQLTQSEAFAGTDAKSFTEWLNLAHGVQLGTLVAGSQDIAACVNAVRPFIESAETIGNFRWKLATKWGDVIIQDTQSQTTDLSNVFLLIDFGGADFYIGGSNSWCSAVIDAKGSDFYLGDAGYKGKPVRLGSSRAKQRLESGPGRGFFGIGIIADFSGDDVYRSAGQAFGSATFGVSYLMDADGKDTYDAYTNSIGYGFFGLGILEDMNGDDEYRIFTQGEGCGMTDGVGWLVDRRGSDRYIAEDEILDFKSPQSATHNVSMSQGAGYGIRLDYIFGHSLSGGFGLLFDLEGKDSYSAGVFAQGTGYWMGFGGLWDRNGDDQYNSVWYGQGSAAHFAIGYLQDDEGADTYVGTTNMTQGAGHDFSLGMLIDSAGNDRYMGSSLAFGGGNANGFGVFIDLAGDDDYVAPGQAVLGQSNESPEGSLRSLSLGLGLFIDGSGNDSYSSSAKYARNGAKNAIKTNDSGSVGVFWDQ
ncbi:MAG: hypothetical protein ACKVQS_01740 [Fimbriimonadaceae bacterium]